MNHLVKCDHIKPHYYRRDANRHAERFREWFRDHGWLNAGYCFGYYPRWIRRFPYRSDKGIKIKEAKSEAVERI